MPQKRTLTAVVLAVVLLPITAVLGVQALSAAPSGPKLHLRVGSFDPAASTPTVKGLAAAEASSRPFSTPGRPAAWIVQAKDAAGQPAVVEAVQASGAAILGYVPDQAYAVYATPEQRTAFINQAGPLIHFAGPFQPSWRVRPAAGQAKAVTELSGPQEFVVTFFHSLPAARKAEAFRAVAGIRGVRVVKGAEGQRVMRVSATSAQVDEIAAVAEVEWVDTPARLKLHNATARWLNDTGNRETLHITKPVGGLTGAGQTTGVADTGINYIPDVKGDALGYFSDCSGATCKKADYELQTPGEIGGGVKSNATGHRKMAAYFDLGASGARASEDSSHGAHVAGSVTGNIAPVGTINEADGIAWASRLVHENIADPEGGLTVDGVYELLGLAYRPSNPTDVAGHEVADFAEYDPLVEARTHNNSWGGDPVLAADYAVALDQFVWDHEDMAVIVSAGNDGTPAETGGSLGTVGAPATAKNDITSGASANADQPMASFESAASFSSHGPTADQRFGPDLMTPGQTVISAKGGSANEAHYMQGTSMSAPVLTGLSTLVRQYFWDGYGPTPPADKGAEGFAVGAPAAGRRFNPSAALVKAVMVNGATRMRGFYTGDNGNERGQDGQYPSAGQGFGQVNLDNSLYLPGDPTTLWVKDVWRDSHNGRAVDPADPAAKNPEAFPGASATPVERVYQLTVGAGQPLDVTLAWTDSPNLAFTPPSLVNNLDLTVTGPDGTTVFRGNNFNTRSTPKAADHFTEPGAEPDKADTRNNVEKVRVAAPTPGVYTVKVTANQINSTADQGFSLAAAGVISAAASVPSAPAIGAGWRSDASPGAAPAVVGATVDHVSNDTVVVNVTTNELTKSVVKTATGGVFRSVDTVGPDGFPGLPSGFEEEIPDNTGFALPPGGHDVVSTKHRIFVTGARSRDTTMTVEVTDLEGKTGSLYLGRLSATPGAYQAPLDDIAQFDSADPDYGGFGSKSTQLYVGNLGGTPLLGTYKFNVPESYDVASVGGAVVETNTMHDLTRHDEDEWLLRTELLPNSVEGDWRGNDYESIHEAAATARLNPMTGVRRGMSVYSQAVTCSSLQEFRTNLADRNAAFRMEADTGVADSALSFEPGANRRSKGPHLRPNLVLYKQQANGTLLDPRPCDANAPAPAVSDVRVEHVPDTNHVTYSAVVSWVTDVPSDSTVLYRPRGSSDASWVEVSVPGRTTSHQVEVKGLTLLTDYEFVVNSASCNGKSTTDTNGGAGYAFLNRTTTPFNQIRKDSFDAGDDGWTAAKTDAVGSSGDMWTRETDRKNSGTHSWSVAPYGDAAETTLTSPTFNTVTGRLRVAWMMMLDTEKHYDFLHVEYNTGGGWTTIARFDGESTHYEAGRFDRKEVEAAVPAAPAVQVRFRFKSDGAINSLDGYEGVWVDDVVIGQHGPGIANAVFPVKAPSAQSTVTAPAVPLRATPTASDVAAGTARCAPITTTEYVPPPPPVLHGYWLTSGDAGIFSFGNAHFHGSMGGRPLNQPVVGMAAKADRSGYWQVASDGGVFTFGNAHFHGSMGGRPLNKPVVGMAALPDGSGYWLVASDGGVFTFGNAQFHGATGHLTLNKPIVGMAAMPDGSGYWLVASDGGIFSFGSAKTRFYGSAANLPLSAPIVGMEPTPAGDGYWLVGRNGAVFAFGAAVGRGSMLGRGVNDIVGIAAISTGEGYWLVGANGAVYPFGKAPQFGGVSHLRLVSPIVGVEGF